MARTRSRQGQDLEAVKYIKDERGRVILRQEDIKIRWLQYFSQLLNESRPKEEDKQFSDVQRPLEDGSASAITTKEVEKLSKRLGERRQSGQITYRLRCGGVSENRAFVGSQTSFIRF